MKSVTLLSCGAALLLAAAPAAGQRIDSPYRFVEHSQTAGVLLGHVSTSKGPLGLGPESAVAFGGRYGISVMGPIVVEVELLYSPSTRAVLDTAYAAGPDSAHVVAGEADMNLLVGMANLRFNVTGPRTWNRIQPFGLFGVGIISDLAGSAAAEEEVPADARLEFGTGFAGQLGAGAEYHLSPRWAVRADARTALWKLKNPTAFRLQGESVVLPADQWESNTVLTAGLSMRF